MWRMAHHASPCGHAQHFHAQNQQPISNGNKPHMFSVLSSFTDTPEHTGAADENRRRERRYVAPSPPHD